MLEAGVRGHLTSAAKDAWSGMPERAVRAASGVARKLGIAAGEAKVLRASFSIYVHLAPAPIAARVAVLTPLLRDPIVPWLAREVAVAGFLAEQQLPVLQPVDPNVHEHDDLFVTLWELADAVEGAPDPTSVARSLYEVHTALRNLPTEILDGVFTPMHDVATVVRLGAEETALRLAELTPRLTSSRPMQALHGDAHANNLLHTRHGWRWHDFEETCLGPLEWDLATMTRSERIDGQAALRAYADAPPYAELQPWTQLRELQVEPWEVLRTAVL